MTDLQDAPDAPTQDPIEIDPPNLEKPINLFVVFFVPFVLLFVVSILAGVLVRALGLSTRWFMAIVQTGAVILPTIYFFRRYDRPMVAMTGVGKLRAVPLIGLLLFCAGLVVMSDTVMHKVMEIAPTSWAESFEELLKIQARLMEIDDLPGYLWYFAIIVFGAGIFEELLFRGLIFQASLQRMGVASSVVLNGVLFGVMHQDPIGFLFYFSLGAILAYTAWRTGSLIYGIILHSVLNLSVMIVARYFGALDRLPLPVWVAIGGGLSVMVIGFLLFTATTKAGLKEMIRHR